MTATPNANAPTAVRPRSVYVHVPFCRHRCGYCNFSVVAGRDYLVDRYLNAIATEIGWLEDRYEIDTLFLGGGTPSHLSPDQLQRLMNAVRARFDFAADIEFSAECNPNDLDQTTAAALADCGVNRMSLGVQSLNPDKLKILERDHSVEDVRAAVQQARTFANSVSIDLIFAAPNETFDDWQQDLVAALSLETDHVSAYELTYEKGTQFWNRQLHRTIAETDESLRADMYLAALDAFESVGLSQYEISSFAAREHRCRHNEIYWNGQPYFAFGPGASRFVDGVRETNHSSTMQYLKQIEQGQRPVADSEQLPPAAAARERLAIGLRHVDGVDVMAFQQATGFAVSDFLGRHLAPLCEHEKIVFTKDACHLTRDGRLIYDHIASLILG